MKPLQQGKAFGLCVLPVGEPYLQRHEEDNSPGLALLKNLTVAPKRTSYYRSHDVN